MKSNHFDLKILFKEAVKNKVRQSLTGYEENVSSENKPSSFGWNLEPPALS